MTLFALFLLALPAQAATKNVTGAATVDPGAIPLGSSARLSSEMCNAGTSFVGGTAFLGTYLPQSMGWSVVSTAGYCRSSRYSVYTYIQCTVALNPGACTTVEIDVTPVAVGDTTLYVSADSANVLRETNELDNRASVVLTTY